jgi:hypothetical protein
MMTAIKSVITEEQAEFARGRGWSPGAEWGWHTPDLWVSESGRARVYPHYKFGEVECWVAACYSRAGDSIPHTSHTYRFFKEAVAVHS